MNTRPSLLLLFTFLIALPLSNTTMAEDYGDDIVDQRPTESPRPIVPPKKNRERRRYVTDHPERSDAGIFHVAAAVGGNFYVEPTVTYPSRVPTGNYAKDFGFQAGAYFDYDYSQMDENIPLALRGFVGYKYILRSIHVFSFDGMVRRMFQFSEKTSFGIGMGASTALWFRAVTDISPEEEIAFLPSLLIGAGFEFNPFMIDFKWMINRFATDATITGFELYFGVRL